MEAVAACALAAPVVVAARGWAVHKYKEKLVSHEDKIPEKLPTVVGGEKSPARPASPQRVWVELEGPEGELRIALHGQVYDITKFAAHHPGAALTAAVDAGVHMKVPGRNVHVGKGLAAHHA